MFRSLTIYLRSFLTTFEFIFNSSILDQQKEIVAIVTVQCRIPQSNAICRTSLQIRVFVLSNQCHSKIRDRDRQRRELLFPQVNMIIDCKVISYNIFEGGIDVSKPVRNENASNRLDAIATFLRNSTPTVVILTELNHFDSVRFSKFANQWNHSHSAFLTARTGFHLGISSSFPLIELAQLKDGMHHGALLVQVDFDDQTKIGIVATHLSPFSPTTRTTEAKMITDKLKEQDLRDWIVAGDLNSLSKRDAIQYESTMTKFTATDKLKAKFLIPNSNSIDYTTIDHFIEQGYIDTLQESSSFRSSVPTKLDVDPMHALQMRLDYILATKELNEKLMNANVLDNETTAFLSDHYPVVASFRVDNST